MNPFDPRKLQIAADDLGDAVFLVTAPGEAHPIAEIDCNVDQPATIATRIASCVNACRGLDIPADVKPGALADAAATLSKWHNWIASGQLAFTQDHLQESHAALRSLGLPAMGPVDLAFGGTIGEPQTPPPADPAPVSHEGSQPDRFPNYQAEAYDNACRGVLKMLEDVIVKGAGEIQKLREVGKSPALGAPYGTPVSPPTDDHAKHVAFHSKELQIPPVSPPPATMDDVWALLPNPREVGAAEYRITYELIEDSADSVDEAIAIAREVRDHAEAVLAKLEGRKP